MILTQEKRQSEVANIGETVEMTIAENQKSFRFLMGTLYPDKVRSILRELSANAQDSHIVAGKKDIPFDVCLPSQFEPTFSVRDYGVSMSHEFMMKGYSIAFYSSKDKTNEENGAMGLGRLSVLSLSDSYVATCFLNGEKRIYSVYVNENGKPVVAFLSKEETNEPDGFLVEASIDPVYCDEFDTKAADIYQYYKVKPNFKNREDFKIIENEYVILDEDFGLLGKNGQPMALMGCYSYPIDRKSIPGISNIHSKILDAGLVVHFKIGEVDIAGNRETLHYNMATINAIKDKLDFISDKIKPVILSNFVNQKGLGKLALYSDLFDNSGKLYAISDLAREFLKDLKIENNLNFDNFEVLNCHWDNWKSKIKKLTSKSFYFEKNMVFVHCDKKSYKQRRAKKFFEDANNRNKKLIFIQDIGVVNCFQLFKQQYDIDIQNEFVKSSSLPFDPPSPKNTNGSKFKTLAYRGFTGSYYRARLQDLWDDDELIPSDEVIYVERKGYYIKDNNYNTDSGKVKDLNENIKKLKELTGKTDITVYGLTARELKNKQPHWREFYSYLKEESDKWEKKSVNLIEKYNYFNQKYAGFPYDLISGLNIEKDSLLNKIYEEYVYLKEFVSKIPMNLVNDSKIKTLSNEYKYSYAFIEEKYPILIKINNYDLNSGVKKDLEEYISFKSLK